jgi:two-component system, OmpR family, sensor histidine kinase MtrB
VLPTSLRAALDAGISGRQRFHDGDVPLVAVGVAIPSVEAQYVEVFPQETLRHTLSVLGNALIGGSVGGLLFGGLFGWWSARRVLLPVRRVAEAAEALAGGALDTRLSAERDVDLNRLVTSFNSMTDAVQQRIEREARFASDVSHELRNPLGALSAAAEVLERRRADLPERAGQAVDVITSQLRRLSTMVLDLLEIARIDAGVADLNIQDTDMAGLVRYIAQTNGVSGDVVRIDRSHGETRAPIDRRRFEQILRNVLDNGEKYGGGIERITVQGLPDKVVVHVDDEGEGVPVDERSHIFERFARGTGTQDVPGTGLGLALASDQATLMGASLHVGDAPLRGARFSIWLPRTADQDLAQ